jgi:uncharacterized phage protein gp47/JayE
MPNFPSNRQEIVSRYLDTLTRTTNINQTVAGSKARAVGETIGREIELLSQLEEANLNKGFLPTTYGQFLEYFATMTGVTRRPARNATSLASDRAVKFYVFDGGTFGSINNDTLFIIPSGTILTAPEDVALEQSSIFSEIDDPNSVRDRSIHYVTTTDTYCQASDKEVFASVRAMVEGSEGNLAAPNMLVNHTFTSYVNYLDKELRVTNVSPILNGMDREEDSSLRYKISQALTAAEAANDTAIRGALLEIPGVADVVIIPYDDGAGRFSAFIKSIAPVVSNRILSDAQERINELMGVGCVGYARSPYQVGIEISSNLVYDKNYKEEEKALIRENLVYGTISYINSLDIGQPLSLQTLASDLKAIDSSIRCCVCLLSC